MNKKRINDLRQYYKRNRRSIRSLTAVFAVFVVALGTAISLFLTAFTQTRTTYCGQEHEHTLQCFSNPEADVETAEKWEKTLPSMDAEAPRVSKLVEIVRSQLGYHESKDNYAVDGDDVRGYTRYGAWDNDPYEPWNSAFAAFCLHYAGIDIEALIPGYADDGPVTEGDTDAGSGDSQTASEAEPEVVDADSQESQGDEAQKDDAISLGGESPQAGQNADASSASDVLLDDDSEETDDAPQVEGASDNEGLIENPTDAYAWLRAMIAAGLYVTPDEANPQPGDLVFLCDATDKSAELDASNTRVAIVSDVNAEEGKVCVVEGDLDDAVVETWYSMDAPQIQGYGVMPQELRDEVEAYKQLVAERKAEAQKAKKAREEEEARKAEEEAAKKAEAEAAKQAEDKPAEVPQVLTAEADGYRVSVNLAGQAQAGYTLKVKPLKVTKKRLAAVEEGLTQELADGATKQAHVDAENVALFDISVRDRDGNEVELSKKVRITVTPLEEASQQADAASVASDDTPEVVHLATEGTEVLAAKAKDEGFTFTTKTLSPFAFVFTVDFEYNGYAWSMAGEGTALLSTVLGELHVADFTIDDVTDVTFSNPELVEVTLREADGNRNWQLTSLKPFTTSEKLTLALTDGSTAVIDVTDAEGDPDPDPQTDPTNPAGDVFDTARLNNESDFQNIRRLLDRVQFYDGETLVGDSSSPDTMVVRPGHEYTMRLQFSEDEDGDPALGQLPDDGVMYYRIPDGVFLSPKAFDANSQVEFEIVLDRKHTLSGNKVTFVPHNSATKTPSYLKIEWNSNDAANYKLLKASPRTVFMLSFPYTTVEVNSEKEIKFSDTVTLSVDGDPTYGVELEKTATVDDANKELIHYEVTAIADGNAQSVTFTDVMGDALAYSYNEASGSSSGITITYEHIVSYDDDGTPKYEPYSTAPAYVTNNMSPVTVADGKHGFKFTLAHLDSGDKAVIKYSANIDYAKLGGKNNIETTSRNTVTATDTDNNVLATATQTLDKDLDYLQIGKTHGEIKCVGVDEDGNEYEITEANTEANGYPVDKEWKYMYVPWKVIYNPDHKINVEGATLKDTVWMGKKYSTSYVTNDSNRPFKVTAYTDGTFTKDDGRTGDTFVPAAGDNGTVIVNPTESNGYGWYDATMGEVTVTEPNEKKQQRASWEWTIPEKSVSGLTGGPYIYVVEYWTKIDRTGTDSGGYVGNQVKESIADITRDKSVELPGIGPDWFTTIKKEHIIDDYNDDGKVYSQWKVSFDRRDFALERALVEDTLPHIKVTYQGVDHIFRDVFVDKKISEDPDHGWKVEGLYESGTEVEQCVPSVSADGYDVVFWFFKNKDNITDPDIDTPGQGLYAATPGMTQAQKKITITFWTENDDDWIQATADGMPGATNEHWNHVHLVLNGKENADKAYGVPKPKSEIKKSVKTVGSWTDGQTVLPVYRYTLSLNGMSDLSFTRDGDGEDANYVLTITDEFDNMLEYLPANKLPAATTVSGSSNNDHTATITETTNAKINGKDVTLDNRNESDEVLVRSLPTSTDTWDAVITGPVTVGEGDAAKKKLTITITISPENWAKMKYQVKKEGSDTEPFIDPVTNQEVWVYGKSYDVSYYLAPEFGAMQAKAQQIIVEEKKTDPKDYTLVFSNKATWEGNANPATTNECTAITDYSLKPVQKQLVNYDPDSELATYSIDVNPLRLKMNNGQRYSVQDAYSGLAVDFQTVKYETFPAEKYNEVEWSYHNNKGVFWVPDETRVRITYEGWPVGKHGATGSTISNTASIGDYSAPTEKTVNLKVDHEGYASTYRVRIFKFEDDNMNTPLAGAVFQLFEKDDAGNIVEMKYLKEHHTQNAAEDDDMWRVVNADRQAKNQTLYPTPENHDEGDCIYFVTGSGATNAQGEQISAQAGFAEVMLSQSRDGVSLKKGKQYYLREVQEPDGHTKEGIDWRFIIGDNDDWDSYVYSDDSVLQVSNASLQRVLTVRKTFIDRTAAQRITYKGVQKDVQFQIVGTHLTEKDDEDNPKVIYNKTVTYNNFMAVGTQPDVEYLLIVKSLPPGNYTVTELRDSAFTGETTGVASKDDTSLSTSVTGDAEVKHVNSEGHVTSTTKPEARVATGTDDQTQNTFFKFTVPASDVVVEGQTTEHTETSATATFTNIYTDPNPVSITVSKAWDANDKSEFTPVKAEFVVLADGVKYDLSAVDGGNERGNIEITAASAAGDNGWLAEKTVSNLPKIKLVGNETKDIVWTVREVSASYRMGGNVQDNLITVTGTDLSERFSTSQTSVGNPTTVAFTNKFNDLTTVTVKKDWSDDNLQAHHTDDVVYFDLYRTTENISTLTGGALNNKLRELATGTSTTAGLEPIIKDIELRYSSTPSESFTYQNSLLEKTSENGGLYYYFALEHSVAGYTDSYGRTDGTNAQTITITNTPRSANEPKGTLTLQKNIAGDVPNTLSKTFKFTLTNSGKYLQANGSLDANPYEFEIQPGEDKKVTISNVPVGTYLLTEVKAAAQVGGYTLSSAQVVVNAGGTGVNIVDQNYATEIKVEANTEDVTVSNPENPTTVTQAIPTNVVVTNTYAKDTTDAAKTKYTFGKLWIMPNPEDTTTLPWPNNVSITMQLGRRIKGQADSVDDNFAPTYTFSKATGDAITERRSEGAEPVAVNNPDAPAATSTTGSTTDEETKEVYNYHHYTFTVNDLPKYDPNGNEYEYFAKETAVTDTSVEAGTGDLQSETNTTGRYFTEHYGVVDGINARILAAEKTDAGADNDTNVAGNGNVGYAINRLVITGKASVPVKKYINGWPNWGERDADDPTKFSTADYEYPTFTFRLYDAEGHEIQEPLYDENGNSNGERHVSVTTNSHGEATFAIPDNAIDPTKMMWWPDEQVLYGTQSFWIREDANPPASATGTLNNADEYAYNGIANNAGAARVALSVKYDWLTGQLISTARVTNSSYQYIDNDGVEWGVINNTYDPDKTTLTVKKTWNDENNRDGYRLPVKFKVHAKYYTGEEQTPYKELDKVWFNKNVRTVKNGKFVTSIERDEIILEDSDDRKEYRITLEPGSSNPSTTTVELPKYYEGHLIYYSVEEMLNETVVEPNVTLANKYTKSGTVDGNDQNVTNTHTPEKVNLHFEKLWEGNETNTDGLTITVRLKASYTNKVITSANAANEDYWKDHTTWFEDKVISRGTTAGAANYNKWVCDWTDLPRYAPVSGLSGKQVTYTVEEVESSIPVGYRTAAPVLGDQEEDANNKGTYNQDVTITNTYESVNIPIQKVWVDDDNRDGLRPQSVTYKLKAEVDGTVIAGDNNGTVVTGNLTYKDGTALSESELSKTIEISGADQNDPNTWRGAGWVNLPKYWHGKKIVYTVTEDQPAGQQWVGKYTVSETTSTTTTTNEGTGNEGTETTPKQDLRSITNTHEFYTTQLTLTKTWVDQNNQDGKRPSAIDFVNSNVHLTAKLSDEDDSMPVELKVGTDAGAGNTYTVVYDDDNDSQTDMVPYKNATVVIQGNNGAYNLSGVTDKEAFLAAYNTYTVTYSGLPRYRDKGKEIAYTFTENPPSSLAYYRVDASDQPINADAPITNNWNTEEKYANREGTASVRNKYDPEHIDLTVTKQWAHGQNPADPKPNKATVKLVATSATERIDTKDAWTSQGYYVDPEKTLTGSYVEGDNTTNGAKYEWGGLPKNMPGRVGEEVTYSVEEVNVPDGYRVVYTPLPTAGLQDKSKQKIAITNTYEETKVTVTKKWDDANNQDGLRKEVKFKLQRKLPRETTWSNVPADALAASDTLTKEIGIASTNTTAEWDHLLAWKNNQRVEYRVVEIPATATGEEADDDGVALANYLTGYTTSYGSFAYPSGATNPTTVGVTPTYEIKSGANDNNATITNTHTPQTYTEAAPLTVTKVWDHKGVVYTYPDYLTTQNYINKLHLWARVEGETTDPVEVKDTNWNPVLVENNDWKSHATVGDGYVVTIWGLPLYKPQSSEVATAQKLEYFISEDESDITHYTMTTTPALEVDGKKLLRLSENVTPLSGLQMKNDRDTGNLEIKKTVDSDLAADHNTQTFSFTIRTDLTVNGIFTYEIKDSFGVSAGGGTVTFKNGVSDTITLKDGQTATIQNLPVGVAYTVTEAQVTDFEAPQYKIDDAGDFATADANNPCICLNSKDQTVKAEFKNIRTKSDLTVSKSVISAVQKDKAQSGTDRQLYRLKVTLHGLTAENKTFKSGNDEVIEFVAETQEGKTVHTHVFDLGNADAITIKDIPTHATYEIKEVDAGGNASYLGKFNPSWIKTVGTNSTESIVGEAFPASGTDNTMTTDGATVAFTNTRKTGTLKLTKKLEHAIPTDDGDTFYFDVTLTGDDRAALDLSSAGAPITVKVNGTSRTFGIVKPSETAPTGHAMYYSELDRTLHNVPVVWLTANAEADSTNGIGGTTEIIGLPVGTTYSVTETGLDTITTADNIVKHSGTVPTPPGTIETGEQTAAFENTRETSGLTISKQVVSPVASDKAADRKYEVIVTLKTKHKIDGQQKPVSVTATLSSNDSTTPSNTAGDLVFTNGSVTINVHDGETVTLTGIPTDVEYTVTEADEARFDTTYTVGSASGQTAEITAGTNSAAMVTNTRQTGSIEVGKYVHSTVSSDKDKYFDFTVHVEDPSLDSNATIEQLDNTVNHGTYRNGSGSIQFDDNNNVTFVLKDGETQAIKGIPVGWEYSVTESAHTNNDSYTGIDLNKFNTVTNGVTDTISAAQSNASFTNTRKTGSLELNKALTNAIPTDDGDTFYFDVALMNGTDEKLVLDANAQIKVGGIILTTSGSGRDLYYDSTNGVIKNVPVVWHKANGNTDAGGSTVITGLPIDTTYTATEVTNTRTEGEGEGATTVVTPVMTQTNDHNYTNSIDPQVTNESKEIEENSLNQTAFFTNTRHVGSLTIEKELISDRANDSTEVFKFTVQSSPELTGSYNVTYSNNTTGTLTFNESGVASEQISLKGGQVATIAGLPVDVDYTVAEKLTDEQEADFTYGSNPSDGKVQTHKNSTNTVKFTNTRKKGNLNVTKRVKSTVRDDKDMQYWFRVDIVGLTDEAKNKKYGGVEFTNGSATFSLSNGEEKNITGLPTDVTYSVTELSADPNDSNNHYYGPNLETTKSGDAGTISATASTAAFTNTRKTGSLTLNKSLTNYIPTDVGDAFFFDVQLKSADGTQNLVLTNDGDVPIKIDNVAVAEANPGTAPTGTSSNPYPTYCDLDAGIIHNVKVTLGESGSGSTVISNLPVGTTCVATELTKSKTVNGQTVVEPVMTPTDFASSIDSPQSDKITSTSVLLVNDKDKTADFTNSRHVGNLKIEKAVTSDLAADYDKTFAFTVQSSPALTGDYNVTYSGGATGATKLTFDQDGKAAGQVSLKSGQSIIIAGLPVDVVYTVTEQLTTEQRADFDATSSDDFGTQNDGKVQTHKDQTKTVTFTNTRKTGELKVTKAMVSPDDADKTKQFEFKVVISGLKENPSTTTFGGVTFARNATSGNYEGTFTQHAGETKIISGLPTDAGYTVTETSVTNYTTEKTGDTGTIADNPSTATFTNKRQLGNLKITKSLTNAISDDTGDLFYFDVQLTDGQNPAKPLNLDLSTGAPPIMVGSTRLASDTVPSDSNSKDLWYEYVENNKAIIHNVPLTWSSASGAENKVLITGLPRGAKFRVVESDFIVPAGMDANNITKDATTLDEAAEITISGTEQKVEFTNVRKTGNLQIKKAVVSPVDTELIDTYTLKVKLVTKNGKANVELSNLVIKRQQENQTETNSTVSFNASGEATIQNVHRNETITIEGIPTDVMYTISEDGADDFTKTFKVKTGMDGDGNAVYSAIPTGGLVIPADDTSEALVTNTRNTGSLKVSKTVKSTVRTDKTRDYTFVVEVAPPTPQSGQTTPSLVNGTYGDVNFTSGKSDSITLKHGEEKTIEGLPTGWTYTVTEQFANDDDKAKYTTDKTDNKVTGPIVVDANTSTTDIDPTTVSFTNTRNTGQLTISKKLDNAIPTDKGDTFYFDVTVKGDDGLPLQLDDDNARITVGETPLTVTSGSGHTLYYDATEGVIRNVPVTWTTPLMAGGFGGSTVIEGLPLGTKCTSAELSSDYVTTASNATAAAAANIDRQADEVVTKIGESGANNQVAQFTNTRKTSSLTISKNVASPIAAEEQEDYEVEIGFTSRYGTNGTGVNFTANLNWTSSTSSGLNGKPATLEFIDGVAQATIKFKNGQSVTLSNVPTDLTYKIIEKDATKYDKTCTITTGTSVQTIEGPEATDHITAANSSIEINNKRKLGKFSVKKNVVSSVAGDKTHEFRYKVEITGATRIKDGTYGEGDNVVEFKGNVAYFTLHDNETKAVTGIPTGLSYTITETDENTASTHSVDSDETAYLGKFGTSWEKTVTNVTEKPTGATKEFPGDQSGINTINDNDALITFTNTRNVGNLEITKALTTAIPDTDKGDTFYFDVKLTADDGQPLALANNPQIKVNGSPLTTTVGTDNHPMYFLVKSGENYGTIKNVPVVWHKEDNSVNPATPVGGETEITGIPVGTSYEVTELTKTDANNNTVLDMEPSAYASYIEKTGTGTNPTGAISDATSTAAFTNARNVGDLKIEKAVSSGLQSDYNQDFEFTVQSSPVLTGSYNVTYGGSATGSDTITFGQDGKTTSSISLKGGQSITIKNLPVGVNYTVTENLNEAQRADFTSSASDGITAQAHKGATNTVTFTNTRKTGELKVTKNVTSSVQGDKTRTYKFKVEIAGLTDAAKGDTYIVSKNGTADSIALSGGSTEIELADGEYWSISGLPTDAEYTVTEQFDSADDGAKYTTGKTDNKDTGTIVVDAVTSTNTIDPTVVSFSNTRKTGQLTLSKTLEKAIPTDDGDTFYYDVKLEGDDGQPLDLSVSEATITVTKSGSASAESYTIVPPSGTAPTGHAMYYAELDHVLHNVPVTLGADFKDSTVISGLPVGTKCTVTEQVVSATDPTVAYMTPTSFASNIKLTSENNVEKTIGLGNDAKQTASFTNKRKTGSLSITKQVVSPIPAERNSETYSVKVTLNTAHGNKGNAGAVSATLKRSTVQNATGETINFVGGECTIAGIHHGETVTIEGIPTDLTYMVEESGLDASRFDNAIEVKTVNSNSEQQVAYVDISNTSVSKDIVAGSTPSEVRVTNTRKTGELVITKAVESTVASDKTTHVYHFEVEILNYNGTSVAIDDGDYGALRFSGNPSKATFTLGGNAGASAWTTTATDLPIGVTYKVTEVGEGDEATFLSNFDTTWSRKIGNGDATNPIAVDGRAYTGPQDDANTISTDSTTITCTNTRKKGSLQLSKVVNSPFESECTAYYPFTINLHMPASSGQAVENISATYEATGLQSGNEVTFNSDGVATVNVKQGVPVTISGLPVGAEYVVSEASNNSALTPGETAYKVVGESGTMSDTRASHTIETEGATYGAEITNTRNQILLTIGKVSALDPNTMLAGARFRLEPDSVPDASTLGWTSKNLVSDTDGYLCETVTENGTTATNNRFSLKPGTYKLIETKAPDGYHAFAQPITFEVTSDYSVKYTDSIRGDAEGVVDTTTGGSSETEPTQRYVIINVANSTGAELPSTGGLGTAAIYAAGCMLLAAASVAALRRRQ